MKVYSVGQINNYIKNIITEDYLLKNVSIRGEVSNCKYHSMGHIYFSLKDETGSLPAVMFKSSASRLRFKLADGQSVVVSGSMGVYERDGRYQLYASTITLDGAGRLYEEFERLKYKLNEEGLFDFEHKKPIPKFPKKVGIVTAKTGAAIQDIINIARRRNPFVQLVLYPAKVQGEGAAETIVKGIRCLDAMGDVDTIIVGRGGGSIEDLWAFNEEIVARAIYEARTPIISGTGHEVDITLADYAADLRAPTPSAACELAIFDVMTTIRELDALESSIKLHMKNKVAYVTAILDRYDANLAILNPVSKLKQQNQYLSELFDRMNYLMETKLNSSKHMLELLTVKLNSLSPTAKLVGGFGYIESNDNPVMSIQQVKAGDDVKVLLSDGSFKAKITGVNE